MKYEEAIEYLHSFGRVPVTTDLHKIKRLLAGLDNPQDSLKFIHIAGTNGKGSVAAFCASALKEAGYKTGLYISPFIVKINERIQINGEYIPDDLFASVISKVKKIADEYKDDYAQFDILTAAAMEWYAKNNCDIVVLETGLGGRLDATNAVMKTIVSVITSVSYDHTEILGNTIEEIAYEKAQIIKAGCSAVVYPIQQQGALDIIMETAERKRAKINIPDISALEISDSNLDYTKFRYKNDDYVITMPGKYQVLNAVTAIEALDELSYNGFYNLIKEKIVLGLMKASNPARFEVVSGKPLVILDGAHNPSGTQALSDTVKYYLNGKNTAFVIAMMRDKNVDESVKNLSQAAGKMIVTQIDNPRCMNSEELKHIADKYCNDVTVNNNPLSAVESAVISGADAVIVCGSLYLVSEIRKKYVKDEKYA